MMVRVDCHLAVRVKKLWRYFLCRRFQNSQWRAPDCLVALEQFEVPIWFLQNVHLFIFTPPGAAVRFADGARKSFSIATCLVQAPATIWLGTCPAVSKNDRPFSVLGGAPTNTGSRVFKLRGKADRLHKMVTYWEFGADGLR
jgi:hypothetical protein